MKKIALALAAFAVVPATAYAADNQGVQAGAQAAAQAAVTVAPGKMLYTAQGARVGSVYRVTSAGSAQVILDGRLITVPAATLSTVNGKLTTSLTKNDLRK